MAPRIRPPQVWEQRRNERLQRQRELENREDHARAVQDVNASRWNHPSQEQLHRLMQEPVFIETAGGQEVPWVVVDEEAAIREDPDIFGRSFADLRTAGGLSVPQYTPGDRISVGGRTGTVTDAGEGVVEVSFEQIDETDQYRGIATMRPPGYWKMRDGRFVPIHALVQSHLQNIIAMLERAALARGRRLQGGIPGSVYNELVRERNLRADRASMGIGISQGISIAGIERSGRVPVRFVRENTVPDSGTDLRETSPGSGIWTPAQDSENQTLVAERRQRRSEEEEEVLREEVLRDYVNQQTQRAVRAMPSWIGTEEIPVPLSGTSEGNWRPNPIESEEVVVDKNAPRRKIRKSR